MSDEQSSLEPARSEGARADASESPHAASTPQLTMPAHAASTPRVTLTPKGRRWLATGHPWIYADDVASADAGAGDLVHVVDHRANHVGWGFYSAVSRIAVRLVSVDRERPGDSFWRARVERAIAARMRLGFVAERAACRLIGGDADGIPGLVVDQYADTLVLQSGTQAADRMRDSVADLVSSSLPFPVRCVVERSDSAVRRLESLEKRVEVLRGDLSHPVVVEDRELAYEVDVLHGHKTGHYLDQRDNRRRASLRARGEDVLDAFSYDGLFGISAALAGARSVVCLDQSEGALERLMRNAERNRVQDRITTVRCDCMPALRERVIAGESYGLVIVDPPAFAKSRREVAGAERGYVELNRRAMELVRPGGTLVSASCSYNLRAQTFVDCLARAAHAARREAYVEELAGASPDHPVLVTLPETAYLKCAFLRVEKPPPTAG